MKSVESSSKLSDTEMRLLAAAWRFDDGDVAFDCKQRQHSTAMRIRRHKLTVASAVFAPILRPLWPASDAKFCKIVARSGCDDGASVKFNSSANVERPRRLLSS